MSRLFVSIVLVVAALASAAPPAAAASLLVCPSGCAYTDIQSAVNAASPGDTIVVRPGTYEGAILVDKQVTLCSTSSSAGGTCDPSPFHVTIDGAGAIYAVVITADDVVVEGFTLQNPTYAATDQTAGMVDPSLVVVFGVDNVEILSNILRSPASPLPPGSSRWHTTGVNVAEAGGAKSDNVRIEDNIFLEFPESISAPGTCANAPCRTDAISLWGAGAAPSVRRNNMMMPPGYPDGAGSETVGIWGNGVNAVIQGNIVQTDKDIVSGLYGIRGTYQDSVLEENVLFSNLHGIMVSGSNLAIRDNEFLSSNEGLRITARDSTIEGNLFEFNNIGVRVAAPSGGLQASGLVFRENVFGANSRDFSVHAQVSGKHFDLRENDWGAYERDQIELFLEDAGTGNTLDISCFIDSDGTTRVCPVVSFTTAVSGASWPRTVQLTDTSTTPGSERASREWTLPGGATSRARVVTLALGPGSYTFGLAVTDQEGFTSSASDSLMLANAAPTLSLDPSYAAFEDALFDLPLGAADADGDQLVYTLLTAPVGASVVDGSLRWTPTYADAGSHPVTVSVTDGAASAMASTTIVVGDVPVGPVLEPIADLSLVELATGTRTVRATSASGSPISLAAIGLPSGAVFTDGGNGEGTVTFTAPAGSAGAYPVTVEATSEGITTTGTFHILVTAKVGLGFVGTTPSLVQGAPGSTVVLTGTITNLGSGPDAFRVTAASSRAGWTLVTPPDVSLAAGASAPASVAVTIPAGGDVSFVTVTVCSTASPTLCKSVKWRVEVPVLVTLQMEPEFGALEAIVGKVTVTFAGGAPAAGVSVIVAEWSTQDLPFFASHVSGTTNAAGEFAFELNEIQAHHLGEHKVFVTAKRGDVTGTKAGSYRVTL